MKVLSEGRTMRGRFIILILMFISLCACSLQVGDSQSNEQTASQQTKMHFPTVEKVETYFEDNGAEFVKLDVPNCICYALYYTDMNAIQFATVRQENNDEYSISNYSVKSTFTSDGASELPLKGVYPTENNTINFCFTRKSLSDPELSEYTLVQFSGAVLYYQMV